MRRIAVVGISGAGKTTLARRLAATLGVPYLELDDVYWHDRDWAAIDRARFRARVRAFAAGSAWVIDGNYWDHVGDLVWQRADTVIWLDLPRARVMWRVVLRTLRRVARQTELWNGNRERWRDVLTLDHRRSIILWSWTTFGRYRRTAEVRFRAAEWSHVRCIRIRTRTDAGRLLDQAASVQATGEPG